MIIHRKEIAELERHLALVEAYHRSSDEDGLNPDTAEFMAARPHLLLAAGFDEYRAIAQPETDDQWESVPHVPGSEFTFDHEIFLRRPTGAWSWFEGITDYVKTPGGEVIRDGRHYLHLLGPRAGHHYESVDKWLSALERVASTPDRRQHVLLPPTIWTPTFQLNQRIQLAEAIPELVRRIQAEQTSLADITWRQLEELVAELLSSRGLEVSVTKRTRDGGRDVIARGELIPGEPMTLAVEVKQKRVVGVADVHHALNANADFPAILIATAGVFSAGVVQERARRRNRLRLLLKDGVALRQWIDAYVFRRPLP